MARLIDPPEDFNNHVNNNTPGVPPGPPEALKRANFLQRKFLVAAELRETLSTGDDSNEQAAIQFFLETFVAYELTGAGFWTWGKEITWAKCEVCHVHSECIEAIWNYLEEDDE